MKDLLKLMLAVAATFFLFVLGCFVCALSEELKPEDFKPVLLGRKDLIRNNLILSNNELCKHVVDSMSLQTTSLNKQLFILLDENKELGRQLKECKKK
jgi:hypothetical protein